MRIRTSCEALVFLWCSAAASIPAQIVSPGPTPLPTPCGPFYPIPDPLGPLSPPADAETTHTIEVFTGQIWNVYSGESIQARVNLASPGDRILLNGGNFEESVVVTKDRLRFEASPYLLPVVWKGAPGSCSPTVEARAPLVLDGAHDIVVNKLSLVGGLPCTFDPRGSTGQDGGDGAPAIILLNGASVSVIATHLNGSRGGDGDSIDSCPSGSSVQLGAGGDGAVALSIGDGCTVWAGLDAGFAGGYAGFSAGPGSYLFPGTDCCVLGAPFGAYAMPLAIAPTGDFQWASFLGLTDCGPSYPAYPDPLPPLLPPATAETSHTLQSFAGQTWIVGSGQSIQAAVNSAAPGDRILLNANHFMEAVIVTKDRLRFSPASGQIVVWTGGRGICGFPPLNPSIPPTPPLTIRGAREVVLTKIALRGGPACVYGPPNISAENGGDGGPALLLEDNATASLTHCAVSGSDGGQPGFNDTCPFGGAGGNGAVSLLIGEGCTVWADLDCEFTGGAAGRAENLSYYDPFFNCCVYASPHGSAAMPLSIAPTGEFFWTLFPTLNAVPSRSWKPYSDSEDDRR